MNSFYIRLSLFAILIACISNQESWNKTKQLDTLCFICDSTRNVNCDDPFIQTENLKAAACKNGEKFCRKIYQIGKKSNVE